MSEHAHGGVFNAYIDGYHESMRDSARESLERLKQCREGDFSTFGETDGMVEEIDDASLEGSALRLDTTIRTFVSVFDAIHPGMMENELPPDFFRDIIALLIEVALRSQEAAKGNVTQLLPDVTALREHVDMIWIENLQCRISSEAFCIYRSQFDGGIISIVVQPHDDGSWKIGYERLDKRAILRVGRYAYEEVDGMLSTDPIEL